jgi:hypothetical protein
MPRISITLTKVEMSALFAVADKELRSPRSQAAFIIRQELQRQGLIEQPAPILVVENKDEETQNDTAE